MIVNQFKDEVLKLAKQQGSEIAYLTHAAKVLLTVFEETRSLLVNANNLIDVNEYEKLVNNQLARTPKLENVSPKLSPSVDSIIRGSIVACGSSANVTELHRLGEAYDMPNRAVDGMQPEEVHMAIAEACERARKESIPTLLEINAYRYKGHSMSDPAKYRTREEVKKYREIDPIEQVRKTIIKKKYATEKELEAMEEKILADVEASVQFAEDSPYADDSELFTDVYKQDNYPYLID